MSILIDTHIHVGQFYDKYYSPSTIMSLMSNVNVQYYAVSSTTQCEEDYEKVLDEFNLLLNKDGKKVLPIMWVTPRGLEGNIAWYLDSSIKWRCIKIHPELHPDEWTPKSGQIEEVINIAKEMNVPILIHTGNKGCSVCNRFESFYTINPGIKFILAHGRPHLEAMRIAKKYDNIYVDSAFMPIEEITDFLKNGLENKILWGTDMCIPKHFFPNVNLEDYYISKLNNLRNHCSFKQFEKVTSKNASEVFEIEF